VDLANRVLLNTLPTMSRSQAISRILVALIVLVVALSITLSIINSQAISSITITALQEHKEPRDAAIIGLGSERVLPDYRLEILCRDGQTVDLGKIPNQSAVDGLTWRCNEITPRSMASALRLIDADPLEPDVVEEVTITANAMVSDNYLYQVNVTRSFCVGSKYFLFSTPVGWVLLGLFALLVIFLAGNICVPNWP
jgi:hypothetical protein